MCLTTSTPVCLCAGQCSLCTDAIPAILASCLLHWYADNIMGMSSIASLVLLQIRVCQYHPEGVVSIKFKRDDAAQECIKIMNGRFFGGRQLTAELWDGTTNYNVRKPQESEEEQAARLARFAAEIEQAEQ